MSDPKTVRTGGPHALEEYKGAQESAQHHDSLIWTTTGLVWTGNFVLLGFVVNAVTSDHVGFFIPLASVLGLVLAASVWRAVFIWKRVMNSKYARCQELEPELFMWQHRDVEVIYPHGEMRLWYSVVSAALIISWLVFFIYGICRCASA